MSESRWIRLNVDFDQSDWIYDLTPGSRLAWVYLLARAKALGFAGQVKVTPVRALAHEWRLAERDVTDMLEAAQKSNALRVTQGTWVLQNWRKYQGDESNADRQKRHRERKKGSVEPERNVSNALRDVVTPTETETETLFVKTKSNTASGACAKPNDHNALLEQADSSFLPSHLPVTLSTERVRGLWQAHLSIQADLGGALYSRNQVRALAAAVRDQGLSEPQLAAVLEAYVGSGKRVIRPQDIRPLNPKPARKNAEGPKEVFERLQRETADLLNPQGAIQPA